MGFEEISPKIAAYIDFAKHQDPGDETDKLILNS
jgi:hypothetical protein